MTIEHSAKVLSSAISQNGKFLATGDTAGIVKLLSIPEGKELSVIEADSHNYGVGCIVFSPDAKTLALNADKIELWEISNL